MKKKVLFSMLLLFVGVSMQAQSIASEQMDERFNDGTKFPRGWFGEGWKVENGKAKAKATEDSGNSGVPSAPKMPTTRIYTVCLPTAHGCASPLRPTPTPVSMPSAVTSCPTHPSTSRPAPEGLTRTPTDSRHCSGAT